MIFGVRLGQRFAFVSLHRPVCDSSVMSLTLPSQISLSSSEEEAPEPPPQLAPTPPPPSLSLRWVGGKLCLIPTAGDGDDGGDDGDGDDADVGEDDADDDDDDDDVEDGVEAIEARRWNRRRRRAEYLVQWKGSVERTWEPRSNFGSWYHVQLDELDAAALPSQPPQPPLTPSSVTTLPPPAQDGAAAAADFAVVDEPAFADGGGGWQEMLMVEDPPPSAGPPTPGGVLPLVLDNLAAQIDERQREHIRAFLRARLQDAQRAQEMVDEVMGEEEFAGQL